MQSRRASLIESIANTAAGFVVSNICWPLISVYLLHKPYRPAEGLAVISAFTLLSILRNWFVRRAFNWWHTRRAPRLPWFH